MWHQFDSYIFLKFILDHLSSLALSCRRAGFLFIMSDIFATQWHTYTLVFRVEVGIYWLTIHNKLIVNYPFIIQPGLRHQLVFKTSMFGYRSDSWSLLNHYLCALGLWKNIHFSLHVIILLRKQMMWVFQEFLANIHSPVCLSWDQFVKHHLAVPDAFAEVVKVPGLRCWPCEGDKLHGIVRYQTRLILSECYSPNLPLWFGAWPWNPWF